MAMESNRVSINSDVAVTLIGENTKFKGNISTHTPIHIDGYFEGEIESDDVVEVSQVGSFNASIKCRSLYIVGSGVGTVHATETVEFTETGCFAGDIETKDLIIVAGAQLDGNVKMQSMRAK